MVLCLDVLLCVSSVSQARQFAPFTWTTSRKSSMESSKSRGPVTHPGLQYQTRTFPDRGEKFVKINPGLHKFCYFRPTFLSIWYVFCLFFPPDPALVQVMVKLQITNLQCSFQMRCWPSSSRILSWTKLYPQPTTSPASLGPPAGINTTHAHCL